MFLALGLIVALGAAGGLPGTPAHPFSETFDSPRALAREMLRRLGSRDAEALQELALTEAEFRERVWPEMPAREGVPADFAWSDLSQKSRHALARTLSLHGGHQYELLDIRFTKGTTPYRTFLVHRRARLRVRDERGREGGIDVFGSVLEKDGRFKLFSFVVDK